MNALTLQHDGEVWRLRLDGDWSLAQIGQIDRELNSLRGPMPGTLICDWSRADQPGMAAVWLLLTRLSAAGLQVRHEGGPPPAVRWRSEPPRWACGTTAARQSACWSAALRRS